MPRRKLEVSDVIGEVSLLNSILTNQGGEPTRSLLSRVYADVAVAQAMPKLNQPQHIARP
jgi:hypothetical protein